MKKLLSIILACAMIMSLFCVVPASAVEYNTGLEFPYAFTDFEDGKTIFTAGNNPLYTSEIVDSGVAARGKVAKMTVSGSANGGPGIKLPSATIGIGDKITLSAWIKSEQALKTANFSLIFYPAEVEGTTGATYSYAQWSLPFDKNNTGWQYVTTTITSDWEGTTGAFSYRWGTTGGLNFSAADKAADEAAGTEAVINDRTYYVDDFEIKVEKAGTITKKAYPYAENVAINDSESLNGLTFFNASAGASVENGTEADPAPSGDKYIRVTHSDASATSGNYQFKINLVEKLKSNHIYLVKFKTRGVNLTHTENKFNQMVYQLTYGTDDIDTTSGTAIANSPNASAVSSTKNGNYKIYKNFYKYNSNSSATDGSFFGDWYTMTLPIVSDSFNVEEDLSTWDYVTVTFWLSTQSRKGQGSFDFDDIQVLDLGPMANGGFDYTAGSAYLKNGGGASLNTYTLGWQFDAGCAQSWATTGSSAVTALQGGSRLPTEQQDDKRGILYGQFTSDALMYKYVPMMAGEKYEIKGYVRGASSTDGYTNGRARLIVDYTGETLDNEVYNVKALGTNGVIYGDWVEFGSSYNMNAPMTVTVDLTNLGLIEGKSETAGIMPRTPKVIIDFDEEWAGNVNAPNTTSHGVYMDGFTMTRIASAGTPTVSAATATMAADGVVTTAYTYATEGNVAAATDNSVYRLVANGKYYGTFYDKNAIVVPEAAREVEGLSLEILPISATGYYGDAVTVAIEAAPSIEGTTLTQAAGSVTIATETAITDAKLIFVTYDANGKMVDWEAVDVTLDAQGTQAYAPVDLTAGSYTKAMLWQDMAECVPLADMIRY